MTGITPEVNTTPLPWPPQALGISCSRLSGRRTSSGTSMTAPRVLLPEGAGALRCWTTTPATCCSGAGWLTSAKKYFVRFRIQVWRGNETAPLLDEALTLKNRNVVHAESRSRVRPLAFH